MLTRRTLSKRTRRVERSDKKIVPFQAKGREEGWEVVQVRKARKEVVIGKGQNRILAFHDDYGIDRKLEVGDKVEISRRVGSHCYVKRASKPIPFPETLPNPLREASNN